MAADTPTLKVRRTAPVSVNGVHIGNAEFELDVSVTSLTDHELIAEVHRRDLEGEFAPDDDPDERFAGESMTPDKIERLMDLIAAGETQEALDLIAQALPSTAPQPATVLALHAIRVAAGARAAR